MRFELTDEQQMIQGLAREFAEQEVKPIAAECDRESRFPHATVKRMGELGLLGIMVPERLGGGGAGTLAYVLALEEVAVACASHAVVMSVSNSLVCAPLAKHGTAAQHERFLGPLASGRALGCFALTEPQAGSDARNLTTLARRDGDLVGGSGYRGFEVDAVGVGGTACASPGGEIVDVRETKHRIQPASAALVGIGELPLGVVADDWKEIAPCEVGPVVDNGDLRVVVDETAVHHREVEADLADLARLERIS